MPTALERIHSHLFDLLQFQITAVKHFCYLTVIAEQLRRAGIEYQIGFFTFRTWAISMSRTGGLPIAGKVWKLQRPWPLLLRSSVASARTTTRETPDALPNPQLGGAATVEEDP
jgi:hypothetical protein